MAAKQVHKIPSAIVPAWVVFGILLITTAAVLVTVLQRTNDRKAAAEAKLASLTKQVEAAKESLRFGHTAPVFEDELNNSESNAARAESLPLELTKLLAYCLLALASGFLTVSSLFKIRAEVNAKLEHDRLLLENQLAIARSLPASTRLLLHRPEFFSKHPNVGVSRSTAAVTEPSELMRLVGLLLSGIVLSAGFIFAASQHFAALEHGYETQRLRVELKKIRDQISANQPSLPASVPHIIVELPDEVAPSPNSAPSYIPTGPILALILAFFAIVGSLLAVLRFAIEVKLVTNRIARAPGARHLILVDFLYSPRTVEETFKPIIADWRLEYFNALAEKRKHKARWISIRYSYRFALAMGLSHAYALIRQIVRR